MKHLLLSAAAMAATLAPLSGQALAAPAGDPVPETEIVSRGSDGRADAVRIDGSVYAVCMDDHQDGCVNPHEAGLKWGNAPLDTWPGEPASMMHAHPETSAIMGG